jgi:hypothetical protein
VNDTDDENEPQATAIRNAAKKAITAATAAKPAAAAKKNRKRKRGEAAPVEELDLSLRAEVARLPAISNVYAANLQSILLNCKSSLNSLSVNSPSGLEAWHLDSVSRQMNRVINIQLASLQSIHQIESDALTALDNLPEITTNHKELLQQLRARSSIILSEDIQDPMASANLNKTGMDQELDEDFQIESEGGESDTASEAEEEGDTPVPADKTL